MEAVSALTSSISPWLSRVLPFLEDSLRTRPRAVAAAACAAVLGLVAVRIVWKNGRIWYHLRGLPKPPGRLPLFGHALTLSSGCPWEIMEEWVKKAGYAPVVVDFLMQSGLLIGDPELLRHVFDRNHKNYIKDTDLSYSSFLDLLGNGIITSHGPAWERQRQLLSGAFRVDILETTAPVAKRAADRLSRKLEAFAVSGTPVDICEEFRVLTLQVICELVVGMEPEEAERVFPALYLPIVNEANLRVWYPWRTFLPTPTNFHYHTTLGRLNAFLQSLVEKRWQERRGKGGATGGEAKDILDRTLDALDPSEWGEAAAKHLRDEIKSFLLAGHETSASMLTWTIFELTQNPAVLEKVLQEGRTVFPAVRGGDGGYDTSPLPSIAELKKLVYTENCLKESLRKYTPVPLVSRDVVADDRLGSLMVPAGTKVFVNIKAVHWNPAFWPEPASYRPERFSQPFDSYHFLPFINGPRNCLGQNLALLESRILLSLLSQRFVFEPVLGAVAGTTHTYMVPVCPAEGMQVRVRRRE